MTTLFLTLPDTDDAPAARSWWVVAEGVLVKSGRNAGWIAESADAVTVGIADPAATRLVPVPEDARGNPQLVTKAMIETRSAAMGTDPHVVTGEEYLAIVDRSVMAVWQAWASAHGAVLDRIEPLAAIIPFASDWHRLRVGDWTVLAKGRTVAFDEPGMTAALTSGATIVDAPDGTFEHVLPDAVAPNLDLLNGRKRRRPIPFDASVMKRMGVAAAILLLLLALMPLVEMIRWNSEASDLDERSAAMASEALGRSVTAEEAEGALRSERIAPDTSAGAMLAALSQSLETQSTVRASRIGFTRGRLSVELAAPDALAIQQSVDLLQRSGWRLSAQPATLENGQARVLLDMEAW